MSCAFAIQRKGRTIFEEDAPEHELNKKKKNLLKCSVTSPTKDIMKDPIQDLY